MTWRVLISAPHLLRVLDEYRSVLEDGGAQIVTLPVNERLGEEELLSVIDSIDGAICGDDPFSERNPFSSAAETSIDHFRVRVRCRHSCHPALLKCAGRA
jgi:hypothetical protein